MSVSDVGGPCLAAPCPARFLGKYEWDYMTEFPANTGDWTP